MKQNDFWTTDRLLPKIKSSVKFKSRELTDNFENHCNINNELLRAKFGNSRTILQYVIYGDNKTVSEDKKALNFIDSEKVSSSKHFEIPFAIPFSKLNPNQISFYKFFRESIEKRIYIEISFPYILLYLQETVLKFEIKDFDSVIEDLIFILKSYSSKFPLLERIVFDYIFDYSLLKKCDVPFDKLSDLLINTKMMYLPQLYNQFVFDYLFSSERKLQNREIDFIISKLYRTSYRNSIAYKSDIKYRYAVDSALYSAIKGGLFNDEKLICPLLDIKIPSQVIAKRKLFYDLSMSEIDTKYLKLTYFPLINDENIKSRTEECIRYIDNKVRYELKMKNALSKVNISPLHKTFLDSIISDITKNIDTTDYKKEKENENKKTVPLREINIDFSIANKIEENSWENTKVLTEGIENDEEMLSFDEIEGIDKSYKADIEKIEKKDEKTFSDFWEFASILTETEDDFMKIIVNFGKEKAKEFALSKGIFFDSLIFSCNQKAEETFGDIIFGGEYEIFPEYIEELKEVFYKE